jgi:hypothetical protein
MEKSTKLIVAAIGLGGLGYFLYKRGLFSKTTTSDVAKDVKVDDDIVKDAVPPIVDTGKKTAVEPPEEVVKIDKPLPSQPVYTTDPVYTPPVSSQPITMYPNDPYYGDGFGFRDNTYYDQPSRIDYTSGKYNQEVPDYYMGRDMVNDRLNQYFYA